MNVSVTSPQGILLASNGDIELNAQRGIRVTLHNTHATAGTPGL